MDPEDYPPIAPAFFEHWVEAVRVIGLLMERVVGTRAGIGDLEGCRAVVGRMHAPPVALGHGDLNRHAKYFLFVRRRGQWW